MTHGPVRKNILCDIIKDAIDKICEAGMIVKAVTCDWSGSNQGLMNVFGVSTSKPYMEINGEKVYTFMDPSHGSKNTRNALLEKDAVFDNSIVRFKSYQDLYDIDSQQQLRLAPNLKKEAVYGMAKNRGHRLKMRVSYAQNVLSESTSAAIRTYVRLGKLPSEHLSAANFSRKWDRLSDIFNTSFKDSAKV